MGGPHATIPKAELEQAEVTYGKPAERQHEHGLDETEASEALVASKLSRGTFAATLFIAAMKAFGIQTLRLEDV